jgi:two-component system, OmpR family, response regulator
MPALAGMPLVPANMVRPTRKKILLIDDDEKLGELLKSYLAQFDMNVTAATHPDEGLRLLGKLKPEAVILDVMLPDKDGFEVCKEIRRRYPTPIIMLTARGDVTDRVVGLEIGADDYLSKPFEPRELVARIQSVLRRAQSTDALKSADVLKSEGLTVDLGKRAAKLKGRELALTTTEFEVLTLFLQNPGTVLSRDRILDHLRGIECDAFNRSIDITVSRLRKKLGDDPDHPRFFKTVWGAGYLFIGKVTSRGA